MERRTTLWLSLLAVLLCPQWTQGQDAKSPKPLVVEILDPFHPRNEGLLSERAPPIMFEGEQPRSLIALRALIKKRVGKSKATLGAAPVAPGIYPSQRELTIRCDPTQAFAWVQGLLQLITFLPGRDQADELRQSPLIYKVTLERSDTSERLKSWLPVDRGLFTDQAISFVSIGLHVPKAERADAASARKVVIKTGSGTETFGASNGLAFHSSKMLRTSFLLQPSTTFLKLSNYLQVAFELETATQTKIQSDPHTPSIYVFEVLKLAQSAGYSSVIYSGLSPTLIKDLESGTFKDAEGISDLFDEAALATPVPEVEEFGLGLSEPEVEEEVTEEASPEDKATESAKRADANAVPAGLEWLAAHQLRNGSWDADGFSARCKAAGHSVCSGPGASENDVGVTGLAVLALLGAGNDHRTGRYQRNVKKALSWLVAQQDQAGCIGARTKHSFTYGHAIATLAFTEAYGLSKSERWKAPAQAAVQFILKAQNPYRGWRYGVRPGDSDASVTGWMLLALKSAKLAGIQFDQNSISMGVAFLGDLTDPKSGRTGYTKRGQRPVRAAGDLEQWPPALSESLTALGMSLRILHHENPRLFAEMNKDSMKLIERSPPTWSSNASSNDMYYWFWGTMATYLVGGKSWQAWSSQLKQQVLPHQRSEGGLKGSFDPTGPWGKHGGRVYSTALMTLTLQSYYRYARSLPSHLSH